jgi:hypothetical protein
MSETRELIRLALRQLPEITKLWAEAFKKTALQSRELNYQLSEMRKIQRSMDKKRKHETVNSDTDL